jgi:SAM-dependent methyltransferase
VENSATADARLLRTAYADSTNLGTRVALYDYQQPRVDLIGAALRGLELPIGAAVLDVGCGYGRWVARLAERPEIAAIVAADLSEGMVREGRNAVADARVQWISADAQRLPMRDASCDAVLAMHMLYHVPDIAAAIGEARRVLRTGGTFLVSTPGDDHLRPLYEMTTDVVGSQMPGINDRFEPARRVLLDAVFDSVELEMVCTEVVLEEPEPAVAFVASTRDLREPLLRGRMAWDDVLAGVHEQVAGVIARDGEFRLPSEVAVFRCRQS